MIIINQDRDKAIRLHKKLDINNIEIRCYNGNIMGYNIVARGHLLGTFDRLPEALNEIARINDCEYKYYVVSGFEDYKESENKYE